MDRYQFENSISAYLDNELNLSQRKEFEDYLRKNSESIEFVDDIKNNIETLAKMREVKISASFMTKLNARLESEKSRSWLNNPKVNSNTIFGFTPKYAGILSVLIIVFVTVGINTITNYENNSPGIQSPTFSGQAESLSDPGRKADINNSNILAVTESDSTDSLKENPQKKYNLKDRIQLVKDNQ